MGLFTTCLRLKDEVNDARLNWLKSPNKTMPAFGKLMRALSRDSNRWFLSVPHGLSLFLLIYNVIIIKKSINLKIDLRLTNIFMRIKKMGGICCN